MNPRIIPEDQQITVDKEKVITVREACEMFGVTEKTHWIRAVHELTSEGCPWALVRLQAICRGRKVEENHIKSWAKKGLKYGFLIFMTVTLIAFAVIGLVTFIGSEQQTVQCICTEHK